MSKAGGVADGCSQAFKEAFKRGDIAATVRCMHMREYLVRVHVCRHDQALGRWLPSVVDDGGGATWLIPSLKAKEKVCRSEPPRRGMQ